MFYIIISHDSYWIIKCVAFWTYLCCTKDTPCIFTIVYNYYLDVKRISCNFPIDPQPIMTLISSINENTIQLQWDADPSPCRNVIDYQVIYTVTSLEICATGNTSPLRFVTTTSSGTISFAYYSTYTISVTARHNVVKSGPSVSITVTTPGT